MEPQPLVDPPCCWSSGVVGCGLELLRDLPARKGCPLTSHCFRLQHGIWRLKRNFQLVCKLELIVVEATMLLSEPPIVLCNEEEGVGRMALVGAEGKYVVLGIGWKLVCQIVDKGCCCRRSSPKDRKRVGAKLR